MNICGHHMPPKENIEEDLDITVRRYAPVVACSGFTTEDIHAFQLPEGFPFLIRRRSGQIVEPVFRYLYERVRGYPRHYVRTKTRNFRSHPWRQKRVISIGTAVSAADNLRMWFGYLSYRGKKWNDVSTLDIHAYANGLSRVVSPRTGEKLSRGTIAQRLTHVLEFYRWANARGDVSIDYRNLSLDQVVFGGIPSAPRIRAFTYEEWGRLRTTIGPLPSDSDYDPKHPEKTSCRDRLICEVAIHTGMRRHEVCALTIYQILSLEPQMPDDQHNLEFTAKGLWLTVVKGGPKRARDAILPVWLIRELLRYAEGEERRRAAEIYRKSSRGREPSALFLNHAWSRHKPGMPLTAKRLTARFGEILRKARFVERHEWIDHSTGKVHSTERPTHTIHDLRHTAAVWRYMVERGSGNPDPWKPIQVMLGHAHKETTINIYIQITNTFEAEVSDRALHFFRGIAKAAPYTQEFKS